MKILEVKEEKTFFVETDEPESSTYRTDGKGYWEKLSINQEWSWTGWAKEKELNQALEAHFIEELKVEKFLKWVEKEHPKIKLLPMQEMFYRKYIKGELALGLPKGWGESTITELIIEYENETEEEQSPDKE